MFIARDFERVTQLLEKVGDTYRRVNLVDDSLTIGSFWWKKTEHENK